VCVCVLYLNVIMCIFMQVSCRLSAVHGRLRARLGRMLVVILHSIGIDINKYIHRENKWEIYKIHI